MEESNPWVQWELRNAERSGQYVPKLDSDCT